MTAAVVDTNVPIAANGKSHATPGCVVTCQKALKEILDDRQRLVLDDGWRILREYMDNLSPTGEPGLGDRFLKWVLVNQANPARCDRTAIHSTPGSETDFDEFPSGGDLAAFDPADRKFVAVSLAHAERPPILQALDSKWWGWRDALETAGVTVKFLCPDDLRGRDSRRRRG